MDNYSNKDNLESLNNELNHESDTLQEDLDNSISLVKTSIENYINNITN